MNCCVCVRFAHDRMRGLEDAGPRPFFASSSWACSSALKIASPPLLSYHLSTIAHLHQPASFCVDTFLLCLPLRCGCSSFPALLGLHVDLLCIAALLRHLGEFPFPSGFSLLPLAAICALHPDATPRLKTFRPPGALGDAPVAAAPHPDTFRRKPGSCWDRFCDGRDAVVSAQLSRCSAIHQSINPSARITGCLQTKASTILRLMWHSSCQRV